MKEPKFSPDMRNIEFGADRERQLDALADASNGMTIDPESGEQYLSAQLAAQLMTFLRRRWLKMLALQIAITVPVTGAIMFTQYQPGGPLDSPTFMTCLLMLAGASLSVGICGFASLDPDAHGRQQLLGLRLAPSTFPWPACWAGACAVICSGAFCTGGQSTPAGSSSRILLDSSSSAGR